MPQLNPSPWFMIFVSTWLSLILLTTKVLTHTSPLNFDTTKSLTTPHHWNWPW